MDGSSLLVAPSTQNDASNYDSTFLTTRGIECVLHQWKTNKNQRFKGAAVVYHGKFIQILVALDILSRD